MCVFTFNYVYTCLCVGMCTCVEGGVYRGQKGASDPLELELQWLRSAYHGFWERNSGPLENSLLLSAEPYLQHSS